MASSRQSGRPHCYESYKREGYGCEDLGPSHSLHGAASQRGRVLSRTAPSRLHICKVNSDLSLGVRDGGVVMLYFDPALVITDSFQKLYQVAA